MVDTQKCLQCYIYLQKNVFFFPLASFFLLLFLLVAGLVWFNAFENVFLLGNSQWIGMNLDTALYVLTIGYKTNKNPCKTIST